MFSSLLILLILPLVDFSKIRNKGYNPLNMLSISIFGGTFVLLTILGAKHVEDPYILAGQIATVFYFGYFIVIVPSLSILENILYKYSIYKNKG
jgi:ubiquinol-cytochrome c reductase cytochrome b subunit